MTDLWIGTSGYAYPEWSEVLYPRGTKPSRMLAIYERKFPLVELNFSYYQMPGAEQLARMGQRVGPGFQFIVKGHRSFTHAFDETQLGPFGEAITPLHTRGQLAGVLCQFPQRFHHNDANRRWIATVRQHLEDVPLAVEFRHASWNRPDIGDWLGDEGVTLVSVDVPDIPALYPRQLVQSGPEIYVRLHSRRAETWYSGADRYDYSYTDAEMQEWVDALAKQAPQTKRAFVLFNNCRRANAVINARRMISLLAEQDHPFHVVAPLVGAEQGLLF